MSAKASGSSAQPNGDAKHRQHNDGSESRAYTPEQKAEVTRIRKCNATSFYEILTVEKTASDGQIKKAYRKISLLTHPDKNGYPGADEAFKMVSRAFQILSDPDKKTKYDRFGGDPDNRFSSSGAQPQSPFGGGGFARPQGAGMGGFYEDEISPEELFNRFFGGGMGGGFPFGTNIRLTVAWKYANVVQAADLAAAKVLFSIWEEVLASGYTKWAVVCHGGGQLDLVRLSNHKDLLRSHSYCLYY